MKHNGCMLTFSTWPLYCVSASIFRYSVFCRLFFSFFFSTSLLRVMDPLFFFYFWFSVTKAEKNGAMSYDISIDDGGIEWTEEHYRSYSIFRCSFNRFHSLFLWFFFCRLFSILIISYFHFFSFLFLSLRFVLA